MVFGHGMPPLLVGLWRTLRPLPGYGPHLLDFTLWTWYVCTDCMMTSFLIGQATLCSHSSIHALFSLVNPRSVLIGQSTLCSHWSIHCVFSLVNPRSVLIGQSTVYSRWSIHDLFSLVNSHFCSHWSIHCVFSLVNPRSVLIGQSTVYFNWSTHALFSLVNPPCILIGWSIPDSSGGCSTADGIEGTRTVRCKTSEGGRR